MLTEHQLCTQHHAHSELDIGLTRARHIKDGLQRLDWPVPMVPALGWKSEGLGQVSGRLLPLVNI